MTPKEKPIQIKCYCGHTTCCDCSPLVSKQTAVEQISNIQLNPVNGSSMCEYTVIENKLAIIYQNQEKILQAIKLLAYEK